MSKAKPFEVKLRDLPAELTVITLDAAAATGVSMATVRQEQMSSRVTLASRVDGSPLSVRVAYTTGQRGEEMMVAGDYARRGFGPIVVLYEMAHVALNPFTTAKLVDARARWCMAIELSARHREVEFIGVPASVWQAGWLGLGSAAGRPALKAASDLAAQHFFRAMRGPDGLGADIADDAADAVNINLWWLDHHLSGLPRLFNSKTSKARARARTKP